MTEENRIKTLIDILKGLDLPGVDFSGLPIEEIEKIYEKYKTLVIDYNKQKPIPMGTNPSIKYAETRKNYVQKQLSQEFPIIKQRLEALV